MIAFVKRLWAAAPVATAVLALALAATLLFGARAALFWGHRHEHIAREQPVAAWMTPGYIAMSWKVPRDVILEAIDAPVPPPRGRMNLDEIARFHGTDVETLIAEAETAIAAWRAAHPRPGARNGDERSEEPAAGEEQSDEPAPAGSNGDGE